MQFIEEILKQAKLGDAKKTNTPVDINDINNVFKMPIQYNDKTKKLNENIILDLELVKTVDPETPIYNNIFNPTNILGKTVLNAVPKYYTTDTTFLKETQQLIKQIKTEDINTISNKHEFTDSNIEDIVASWKEIKGETVFL